MRRRRTNIGGFGSMVHRSKPEIFTYKTLTDLARDARKVDSKWHNCGHDSNGLTFHQCCDVLVAGDEAQVPSARKLLDKLMTNSLEVAEPTWVRDVAGAYPSVPDFLANDPESMYTLQAVECETSPITVWVDMMSSAGVSNRELENRGIAYLALVLKLSQVRPVNLNVCYGAPSNGVGLVMPWQTRPLELATSCATLCRAELTRLPLMSVLRNASNAYIGRGLESEEKMREFFNIPEKDIALQATIIWDTLARENPLEWVNQQLLKAGAVAAPVEN